MKLEDLTKTRLAHIDLHKSSDIYDYRDYTHPMGLPHTVAHPGFSYSHKSAAGRVFGWIWLVDGGRPFCVDLSGSGHTYYQTLDEAEKALYDELIQYYN